MSGAPVLAGSALLAALGREVGDLAAQADQLQDVLAGIGASGAVSDQALIGVQALDSLAQHAAELGAVLCALSAAAPADWRVPSERVLQGAGLASLVHRLSGGETQQAEAEQAGEFELF